MSWLRGNYEITAEASRAYNEAKGRALGEDDDDVEEPIQCACVEVFLHGADENCPACNGTGVVEDRNEWCDDCGLTGRCMDCDPDTYRDRALDR